MKKFYALLFAGLITTALSQAQTTITLSATQDNTIYVEATNNSNGAGQNFTAGVTRELQIFAAAYSDLIWHLCPQAPLSPM